VSAPAEPALCDGLPETAPGAGEEAGAIAPGTAPARGPAVPALATPPPTGGNAELGTCPAGSDGDGDGARTAGVRANGAWTGGGAGARTDGSEGAGADTAGAGGRGARTDGSEGTGADTAGAGGRGAWTDGSEGTGADTAGAWGSITWTGAGRRREEMCSRDDADRLTCPVFTRAEAEVR
jgi:hypothetical protein